MEKIYDIQEIMNLLPHRYPFLLVDRILEIVPNEKIVALKNVTINEPFFQGHFPGAPIMPGVLIVEARPRLEARFSRHPSPRKDGVRYFILWGWIM